MKNNWYILAFGVLSSIIIIMTDQYWLFILYVCWLYYLFTYKKVNQMTLLLAVAITILFYYYIPSMDKVNENKNDQHTSFQGKITSEVKRTEKTIQFHFEDKTQATTYAVIHFLDDSLEVTIPHFIQYGATCSLKGEIDPANQATNPHQFDFASYLQKQGIDEQVILRSLQDISCKEEKSFKNYLYKIRSDLLHSSAEKLSPETVSWLHALVLGDKAELDKPLIQLFQRWGLSHILAISGLHVGIIVGLIYFIFVRFSITTKEKAQVIIMIFLPIYAILAGSEPSVLRASFMIVVVLLFHRYQIRYQYADVISIIFLLLILYDPYIVYHIGFQFSFAVTFGLLLSHQIMRDTSSNLKKMIQISFISQMVILPLQLYYFSIFEPLSILVNVIVVPYFSLFVIPVMFFLLLMLPLPSILLQPLDRLFSFINEYFLQALVFVDTHLHHPFIIGKFPFIYFLIYYVIFVLLMIYYEKQAWKKAFQYGVLLSCLIIFLAIRPYLSPEGKVTMLDIGQGDAILIELPYRKGVFFIDAGASFSFHDMEPTSKVYEQVIRPYLLGEGIWQIDAIFMSHEHVDHHGSVPFIVADFPTNEIIISDFFDRTDPILTELVDRKEKVTIVSFNETFVRNGQAFKILSPEHDQKDANENSLAFYTEIGGLGWLFTGDIGKGTEEAIVRNFSQLRIDVLKVAHHGSDTSTSEVLLAEAKPQIAWIGVGRNNRYNHPKKEVITSLEQANISIYRTDEDGAIQYKFKDKQGAMERFLKQNRLE